MAHIQGANIGIERDIFYGHVGISLVCSIIQVFQNLFHVQFRADARLISPFIAVAVYIFIMASVAEIKLQDSVIPRAIAGNIRIMAGATATVLPVFIPWPKMGWIVFVIWMSFFIWVAYSTYPEFYQLLCQAAIWAFGKLKSLSIAMRRYATGGNEELDGTA